jgi:hypothetical protein
MKKFIIISLILLAGPSGAADQITGDETVSRIPSYLWLNLRTEAAQKNLGSVHFSRMHLGKLSSGTYFVCGYVDGQPFFFIDSILGKVLPLTRPLESATGSLENVNLWDSLHDACYSKLVIN